jgi:hypothetical protein
MSWIGWCFAAFCLIAAAPAHAWSDQGHMATGAIAYDRLSASDPTAIAAIVALMADHPDRERFDSSLAGFAGAARDRRLFELIARWPDAIRPTHYNHTHWHHELRVVVGWKIFGALRLGAADHAFTRNLKIVRDTGADPGARAIALCWLFHILGDMHQPLHAGHRMSARFPLTDRAGSLGWVRRGADMPPENLHHFWDTAADRPGDAWVGADGIALAAEAGLSVAQPAGGDYRDWRRESERIAATIACRGTALRASRRPADAPILSPAYVAEAGTVAEQRLGQAGERLGNLLAGLFPPG